MTLLWTSRPTKRAIGVALLGEIGPASPVGGGAIGIYLFELAAQPGGPSGAPIA